MESLESSPLAALAFLAVVLLVDPVPLGPGRAAVRADGRVPAGQDERGDGPRAGPPVPRSRSSTARSRSTCASSSSRSRSQTTITKDNAPINVDFLIYWRIVDPLKSVVNAANFAGALQGVATTTLRAVIGDILLDDVLSKREQINEVLRVKLDEVTERWGGKVTTVEIREITPPRDVQDAMNRQLSAERTRRAVITESEGTRQAAINVAEGEKQSEILEAEGDRQAAILRAEGFSQALERIYGAASADRREDDGAPVPRGAQGASARARRRSSSSRPSSPGSPSRSAAT